MAADETSLSSVISGALLTVGIELPLVALDQHDRLYIAVTSLSLVTQLTFTEHSFHTQHKQQPGIFRNLSLVTLVNFQMLKRTAFG